MINKIKKALYRLTKKNRKSLKSKKLDIKLRNYNWYHINTQNHKRVLWTTFPKFENLEEIEIS